MFSFAGILFLGFLLGMRHATDADHVVAITTIVTKQRGVGKAALIGALWGLGHTFTIFIVGAMIILFQVTIPARVGLSMEFAVAAMLILLGIFNLTGIIRRLQEKFLVNSPMQTPTPFQAAHPKSSPNPSLSLLGMGLYNVLRPLIIGVVHGLAGSAAVALLVMTAIHDAWWSIAYLLIFGLGTIAGMMLITMIIATPFAWTDRKFSGFNRGTAIASGLLSLSFGVFLSYQIGFVDGLFRAHPLWNPH